MRAVSAKAMWAVSASAVRAVSAPGVQGGLRESGRSCREGKAASSGHRWLSTSAPDVSSSGSWVPHTETKTIQARSASGSSE